MKLAWKIMLLAAVSLVMSAFALASGYGLEPITSHGPVPDVVDLRPGAFRYRANGDFTRDGRPTMPPTATVTIERTLSVMRHQVTAADYRRCVEAKACQVVDADAAASDLPAVKASWRDASAYAAWLSRETGTYWRL